MIRDHHCGSARIHGTTSVVAGEQALDHDRPGPVLANPAQVVPGHSRAGQRGRNINQLHRALAWDDHVRQPGETAVEQVTDQPSGARQHLRKKWNLGQQAAAHQFFHAIAEVALAHSRYRRVDGDHQGGATRHPGPLNHGFGSLPASHQVQLKAHWSGGRSLDVFHPVSGDGRENVCRARRAGRPRRALFAIGMHEAAVTYGGQQGRK